MNTPNIILAAKANTGKSTNKVWVVYTSEILTFDLQKTWCCKQKPVNLIVEALIFSFSQLYLMFFSYFCSSFTRTHLFVRWK